MLTKRAWRGHAQNMSMASKNHPKVVMLDRYAVPGSVPTLDIIHTPPTCL